MSDATLLQSLIAVPYVPLLGLVHPDCLDEQLLIEIFCSGATDKLLPYDKDCRWYDKKPAMILVESLYRSSTGMIIPIISCEKESIRLLCYGEITPDEMDKSAAEIRSLRPKYHLTATTFVPTPPVGEMASIMFLKNFTQSDVQPDDRTTERIGVEDASGLASLAEDAENVGFGFLAKAYTARDLGPSFVVRDHGRVVAAVGPIDIMSDNKGRLFCLPPYVGVASEYRGRGLGTRVWQAAMSYATISGASYLVLQAEAGQAAEQFYERLGLVKIGAAITNDLPISSSRLLN